MSGTNCSERKRNNLSAVDVCSLIKACSESGVIELTFGDLHISFVPKAIGTPPAQAIAGLNQPDIEQIEIAVKTDQLDHMLVEDPVEYERLRASGELTDGHSRTNSAV